MPTIAALSRATKKMAYILLTGKMKFSNGGRSASSLSIHFSNLSTRVSENSVSS